MKVTLKISEEQVEGLNLAVGRNRNYKPTRKELANAIDWIVCSYLESEVRRENHESEN